MKVSKINLNSITLKRKEKSKNKANAIKDSNSKTSFMKGLSFNGYMSNQQKNIYGTSGGCVSTGDVGKGWHSDIKEVTQLKRVSKGWGGGTLEYGVYIADVDEVVNRSKLPWNADFLVEYKKPDPIKFKDVSNFVQKGEPSWGNYYGKQLDYTNAWKDLYQRELDGDKKTFEESVLIEKLDKLGKKVDAYNQLNNFIDQADNLARLQKEHSEATETVERCKAYKLNEEEKFKQAEEKKKILSDELNANVESAQKQYDDAPLDEKDEYQAGVILAKAQFAKAKPELDKYEKEINDTKENVEYYNGVITENSQKKETIENNSDFKTADSQRKNILEQIKQVYEEHFPELMGE